MNQIDRLFKVIYRNIASSCAFDTKEAHCRSFDLNDGEFVDEITRNYELLYPENYNAEEIKAIIYNLQQEITRMFSLRFNQKIDALFMFLYTAEKLLNLKSGKIEIDFDALFEWDGLVSKIDSVAFYAAFLSKYNEKFSEKTYEFLHNEHRIYDALSQGVYDTHMHLNGSGYSWELNWKKIACGEPQKSINFQKLQVHHASFTNCDDLNFKFLKIRALRLYLILILLRRKSDPVCLDITRILNAKSELDIDIFKDSLNEIYTASNEYFKKFSGNIHETYLVEQKLMTELFRMFRMNLLTDENCFCFNLYISIISDIKFCFVQDNQGIGFAKFKESETIKDVFLNENDRRTLIESVFDKYYSEKVIRGVEMRIAPKNYKTLLSTIKNIHTINSAMFASLHDNQSPKLEIGLLIHYIKQAETDNPSCECRHFKLRQALRNQAVSLNKYFEQKQDLYEKNDVKVIGIDAANGEIFCPPEVFAPIFRQHRESIASSEQLGFTYHVGEDFLTITSGLRAIDEAITFMCFTRGDRLGHAIALGIDIDRYYLKKRDYTITTLQSLVDDIAWLHLITETVAYEKPGLRKELEYRYIKYASSLYADTGILVPCILDYQMSWALRADKPESIRDFDHNTYSYTAEKYKLNDKNPYHEQAILSAQARELARAYHYNPILKKNGQASLILKRDDILYHAAKEAQAALRAKIYNIGIVIETNPTSNKKISSISRYDELPLLKFNQHRLTPPDSGIKQCADDLPVTINTDDSAIFQTNLSNEYSLVALALIKKGFSKEEVFQYIDYLRELSCQTTFLHQS